MGRVCICPTQIQNGVGEFSTLFSVEGTNPQENLRDDILIKSRLPGRWNCGIFPCDPTRRVGHAAVFFGEARAWQSIDRCIDVFLFFGSDPRRSPELAGLVLVISPTTSQSA